MFPCEKKSYELNSISLSMPIKVFFFQNYIIKAVFVFVALRHKSIAIVMAGRSFYLTTLFPGRA